MGTKNVLKGDIQFCHCVASSLLTIVLLVSEISLYTLSRLVFYKFFVFVETDPNLLSNFY